MKFGVKENNNFVLYKNNPNKITKVLWKIIELKPHEFILQNQYNKKYLQKDKNKMKCSIDYFEIHENNINKKLFFFQFLKSSDENEYNNKHTKIVEKEPIDVVIKYIDLTDKTLNRTGISQIPKDEDNEELRYSVRSILRYIPWIRKIFIVMPNEKVKFFKPIEEIKKKIIYIKDKDLLGFDSANNQAFLFNYYKLDKFGVSRNFIYMDDDYFIGRPLKKTDFFYYDEKDKKVKPFLIIMK